MRYAQLYVKKYWFGDIVMMTTVADTIEILNSAVENYKQICRETKGDVVKIFIT